VATPAGQRGGRAKEVQKIEAIEIVLEQAGAENSAGGRVKDTVGKLVTRDARHEHDASAGARGHRKSCVFRHTSGFEQ
jgi:hypothetical protein